MKIVVIGAGNVATHLAKAIYAANVEVTQVWSYHNENAQALANQINAKAIASLSEIDLDANICLISIKDDAIADIANQLKHFKGVIAHTSGAVNLDVFESQFENYGVFYPLQTFSKASVVQWNTTPMLIEATSNGNLELLERAATLLHAPHFETDTKQRKYIHLTAVLTSNFANHLLGKASALLEKQSIDYHILQPLVEATIKKAFTKHPFDVQTGPAIRNDTLTIEKHLSLLQEDPLLQNIYSNLTESIQKTGNLDTNL